MTFAQRASKTKALAVATVRENKGMAGDVLEEVAGLYFEQGMPFEDALESVKESLIQKAVDRYSDKIRSALQRAGLDLPEGALTLDGIKAAIIEKSGLEMNDLTPEAMVGGIDKLASSSLSRATGIPIASVADGQALGDIIKAGVRTAIDNGTAEKLIMGGLSQKARAVVTWRKNGFDPEAEKKAKNAYYQKRYRRSHKLVWD